MTETDLAIAVTDHNQGGETEAATTLHNLGDTIDVHQLVDQVAVFFLAAPTAVATATAFTAATVTAAITTTATAAGSFGSRRGLFVCHVLTF
jgi:hypothetical protein